MGAAILAGNAVGMFDSVEEACERMVSVKRKYMPIMENEEVYDDGYAKFKKLFADLTSMFNEA